MNIEMLHWAQQRWVARIMYVSCPLLHFVSFRGHPGPHWGWERWDRWFPCFGVYTLCLLKGSNPRCHRQHFRLSICFDFYWAWQLLNQKQSQITIWWWDEQACLRCQASIVLMTVDKYCDKSGLVLCMDIRPGLNTSYRRKARHQDKPQSLPFQQSRRDRLSFSPWLGSVSIKL